VDPRNPLEQITYYWFDARAGQTVRRGVIVAPQAVKIERVSKLSALRKFGVVTRMASDQAGRNRTVNAILSGARATFRSFSHAMHVLWLEVTGTLFLSIAFFGGVALVRECLKYQSHQTTASRVAIAMCFTLAFAWFGVSSFWRVHRKSQRQ
jgi:hypothetical protein